MDREDVPFSRRDQTRSTGKNSSTLYEIAMFDGSVWMIVLWLNIKNDLDVIFVMCKDSFDDLRNGCVKLIWIYVTCQNMKSERFHTWWKPNKKSMERLRSWICLPINIRTLMGTSMGVVLKTRNLFSEIKKLFCNCVIKFEWKPRVSEILMFFY